MSSIYGHTGNINANKLMSDALRHWSPDRENHFQNDEVLLGALELYKTPECSLTPQPYQYKNFVIVADCRIDNREELSKKLNINDISKHSDVEFILFAFEKYGKDCVNHLIGDFAFVIWNISTKELFAARDHMGVRPLYYSVVDGQLVFASEVKGILVYPKFEKKINEAYIAHHFSLVEYPTEFRMYENLFLLNAGHTLTFKDANISKEKYWHFGMQKVNVPSSRLDAEKEFERLFFRAVKDRLRTYRKLGAEVSGGLDSTGIAGVAMQILGKGSEFYSYCYGKADYNADLMWDKDDTDFVRKFCKQYDIEKYLTVVNEKDFSFNQILELFEAVYDEIESNGVPLFSSSFLQYAKKQNVGVMMSGWAGDQVVTNTVEGFYNVKARERKYRELWQDIRRKHPFKRAVSRFAYYILKELDSKKFFRDNLKTNRKVLDSKILKESLVSKYNLYNLPSLRYFLKNQNNIQSYFTRNITHAGIEMRTVYHVHTGLHFNIDYRFPMVDIRLLEFVYSLPMEIISYNGRARYLFSNMILPYIPREVVDITKSKVPTTPFVITFREMINDEMIEKYKSTESPDIYNFMADDVNEKVLNKPSKDLEHILFLKLKLKK